MNEHFVNKKTFNCPQTLKNKYNYVLLQVMELRFSNLLTIT